MNLDVLTEIATKLANLAWPTCLALGTILVLGHPWYSAAIASVAPPEQVLGVGHLILITGLAGLAVSVGRKTLIILNRVARRMRLFLRYLRLSHSETMILAFFAGTGVNEINFVAGDLTFEQMCDQNLLVGYDLKGYYKRAAPAGLGRDIIGLYRAWLISYADKRQDAAEKMVQRLMRVREQANTFPYNRIEE